MIKMEIETLDEYIIFGLVTLLVLSAYATAIQNIYFVYVVWILFLGWVGGIFCIAVSTLFSCLKVMMRIKVG